MRNLALEGKIPVFKALSMVDIALITNIPTSIMKELSKIQKEYTWKNKNCCLHLTSSPFLPSAIVSQALWFNQRCEPFINRMQVK